MALIPGWVWGISLPAFVSVNTVCVVAGLGFGLRNVANVRRSTAVSASDAVDDSDDCSQCARSACCCSVEASSDDFLKAAPLAPIIIVEVDTRWQHAGGDLVALARTGSLLCRAGSFS